MKWIAAKVTVDGPDTELAIDLVADVFYTLDLKGVLVEDPTPDFQQDWSADAVRPSEQAAVTGYFADTGGAADRCRDLESALNRLAQSAAIQTTVNYTRIDEADWAEAWKEHFWPVRITDTIVVKPSWRTYTAAPNEVILEIDPGMAFGTGTHPTTALCIQLLQRHLRSGDTFLDVGTGSGILMIAAAKLGAATVSGIDTDAVAISVAAKNLAANGIVEDRVRLASGHLVEGVDQRYDVVAANILAEVVLLLLPDVAAVLNADGVLICSGIVSAKKESVLLALEASGFVILDVLESADWIAIAAMKQGH